MKRHILAIILFYLIPIFGFRQIMVGPNFGVNMATQFKSDYSIAKFGIAFGGAVGLRYSHGLVPTNNYQTEPADVVYKTNKAFTLSIIYFLYL